MSIDAGAVQAIANLATQAAKPTVREIAITRWPGYVTAIASGESAIEFRLTPPAERRHALHSVDSLIEFISRAKAAKHNSVVQAVEKPAEPTPPETCVWIGPERVTVVLDDATRYDLATMLMAKSEPFALISSPDLRRPRTQRDFITLLRTTLAPCIGGSNLLALCRNLKFTNNVAGAANIQQGRESLGRQIVNEVLGEEAMPELVDLNVRLYDVAGMTKLRRIQCALIIDAAAGTLSLHPLPSQIVSAVDEELSELQSRIVGETGAPCYLGDLDSDAE